MKTGWAGTMRFSPAAQSDVPINPQMTTKKGARFGWFDDPGATPGEEQVGLPVAGFPFPEFFLSIPLVEGKPNIALARALVLDPGYLPFTVGVNWPNHSGAFDRMLEIWADLVVTSPAPDQALGWIKCELYFQAGNGIYHPWTKRSLPAFSGICIPALTSDTEQATTGTVGRVHSQDGSLAYRAIVSNSETPVGHEQFVVRAIRARVAGDRLPKFVWFHAVIPSNGSDPMPACGVSPPMDIGISPEGIAGGFFTAELPRERFEFPLVHPEAEALDDFVFTVRLKGCFEDGEQVTPIHVSLVLPYQTVSNDGVAFRWGVPVGTAAAAFTVTSEDGELSVDFVVTDLLATNSAVTPWVPGGLRLHPIVTHLFSEKLSKMFPIGAVPLEVKAEYWVTAPKWVSESAGIGFQETRVVWEGSAKVNSSGFLASVDAAPNGQGAWYPLGEGYSAGANDWVHVGSLFRMKLQVILGDEILAELDETFVVHPSPQAYFAVFGVEKTVFTPYWFIFGKEPLVAMVKLDNATTPAQAPQIAAELQVYDTGPTIVGSEPTKSSALGPGGFTLEATPVDLAGLLVLRYMVPWSDWGEVKLRTFALPEF